jgi:aromatic-amino-acid transaminase
MFSTLPMQPTDAIMALMAVLRSDPRPNKIDLGVGMYRDEQGSTPVFRAVKDAERILLQTQASKSYLGPTGDEAFINLVGNLVLGAERMGSDRLVGVQTPGGGGALRLAGELIAAANPKARVWLGAPTWPNHPSIMAAVGLEVVTYPWFDAETQTFQFEQTVEALSSARAGDVVLLQGCCHNPTGADPTEAQWRQLANLIAERGLVPLLDMAYQGLGDGLDSDALGARLVLEAAEEGLLAYSCSKNFGLYRERTGALFVQVRAQRDAAAARALMAHLVRVNWSMPPDHGAAVAGLILDTPSLRATWETELTAIRNRLSAVRRALAADHASLAAVEWQKGMFSLLPLSVPAIDRLRTEFGIYLVDSGRVNIAGLAGTQVARFAKALASVRLEEALTAAGAASA